MNKRKIWFDIVNSPHVLVLEPLIQEMSRRGFEVVITAKDHAQTLGMLQQKNIPHVVVGQHGGKSTVGKASALVKRVYSLIAFAREQQPAISACHGSRELLIVSKLLGIPNITLFDYEYSEHHIKNWGATLMMIPDVIPFDRLRSLGYDTGKLYRYPGIKENIYLNSSVYDSSYVESFGFRSDSILVVFRPPATLSHYHDENSEKIIAPLLCYLDRPDASLIVMPRYSSQIAKLKYLAQEMQQKPLILESPVDGPKLLSHADLVISGGGTMIREAAVLDTPAYSIYSGKPGGVDEYLEGQNRLVWIRTIDDIQKIRVVKKPGERKLSSNQDLVYSICEKMLSIC